MEPSLHQQQEEFKRYRISMKQSNVNRLMTRLKNMSELNIYTSRVNLDSTTMISETSQGFREKVQILGLEASKPHHDLLHQGLVSQLETKIQELDKTSTKIDEYTQMRDKYAALHLEKQSVEEQLSQAREQIEFLNQQRKLGSPKFDSDEVLHLDKKMITHSMKHNDLVTKYLVQEQELDRLRLSDFQQRKEIESQHQELMDARLRIQRQLQDLQHMRMIEQQNIEHQSTIESLKTEYVNLKNELEKALAKLHNEGEYIKSLEHELEKARTALRERIQHNDYKHSTNLKRTSVESTEVVHTVMETLKVQYEAQLTALNTQTELQKKHIFTLEDQVTGLTTSLNMSHEDNNRLKAAVDQMATITTTLEYKVHERDEKLVLQQRDHQHYRNHMETVLHETAEDAKRKVSYSSECQLKTAEHKIATLLEQLKQMQNALHAQEIHHKTKLTHHQNEIITDKNNEIHHVKTTLNNHHQHLMNKMQQAIDEQLQQHHRHKVDTAQQIQQLQAQIASHLQTIDQQALENQHLKAALAQHKEANDTWVQHHKHREKDKDHQQQQIQVLLNNVSELQKQVLNAQAERDQKDAIVAKAKAEQNKAKEALAASEQMTQRVQNQLEKKSEEVKLLNQQLVHMIDAYSDQDNQLKQAKAQSKPPLVPSSTKELDEAKERIKAQEAQIKQLEVSKVQQTKQIEKLQKDLQMWQVNVQEMQNHSNDVLHQVQAQTSTVRQHEEALQRRYDQELSVLIKQINEQKQTIERQKTQLQKYENGDH